MKSTAISDLMIRDHHRLMDYLNDVENKLGQGFGFLSDSFNRFQWNLEKHFFVEERVIFTSYNPDDSENEYTYFPDLMDQHIVILNLVETLRNKLQRREPFDISTLKELLVNHKNFEENHVYLVLDQEIDEGEKRFIIERITEIIKERR